MAIIRINGYASIFGVKDRSGDVVEKGAFTKSLSSKHLFPMLLEHKISKPIGIWDSVISDDKGLFVQGRILIKNDPSEHFIKLIKKGIISGLSIGYVTKQYTKTTSGRILTKLDLWEISIVAFPMLEDSRLKIISLDS